MLPKTDAIWHARQAEAEAEAEVEVEAKIARSPGPTISCSIVDNQSPLPITPPLYTHTHTQADCQAWPMWFCAPLAASPRNSPWVIETHFDCCFRSLYVATFWFVSLLLFISLAWVSLGIGLAFWPRESFAPLLLPGHFAAIIKQIKECHCIRLAYTKQQVACCLSHCLAVSEFVSRSLDWTGSQSLTLNRLT